MTDNPADPRFRLSHISDVSRVDLGGTSDSTDASTSVPPHVDYQVPLSQTPLSRHTYEGLLAVRQEIEQDIAVLREDLRRVDDELDSRARARREEVRQELKDVKQKLRDTCRGSSRTKTRSSSKADKPDDKGESWFQRVFN